MALTTNKKNKLIADWKAGRFESYTAIAKEYKIDPKTAKKILVEFSQSNAAIVEVGAIYERAKKSIKNPVELKAIENMVKELSIADEIALDNRKILKEFQNKIKQGLEAGDYENPVDINIGVKTIGEIEKVVRPPKPTVIQNTNAQQNNENNVIEFKRI